MRVALVQHDIAWEQPATTLARVAPLVAVAAAGGARLVVLPEMFPTGFTMAPERVAEPPDGPSTAFLVESAGRHGLWVCGSIPVRDPDRPLPVNRLVLAAPDGRTWHYDKIHPFTYSGEHHHYAAGDTFLTVDVEGLRCSFFVCYDLRFADEFWQRAGVTDCFVVVASWPASRRSHWQVLLRARAVENQTYVVGVNRVGDGDGVAYAGDSQVVDPLGEVLVAAAQVETVLTADLDPGVVAAVRHRYPFLADRRTHPVPRPALGRLTSEEGT